MELDRLAIEIRPRSQWEAIDLGLLAARRWYVPLLLLFAMPLLAVLVLGTLLLFAHAGYVLLLVWWFKPLYERLPLVFLSRVIFEESTDMRTTLQQWRATLLPGLLGALTYRRLSPARSFLAPVLLLERLRGQDYVQRSRVLERRVSNSALWLTVLGVHIESLLALGLLVVLYLFVPQEVAPGLDELFATTTPAWLTWMSGLASILCMALIGPFYVACGFMLYLNRRVELEAWDIEVGFRRLAQRAGVASVLLLALLSLPPEGLAQSAGEEPLTLPELALELEVTPPDENQLPATQQESLDVIRSVLDGEGFNQKETVRYPKWLADWFLDQEIDQSTSNWSPFSELLGVIAEALIWLGAFALILWLAYRLRLLDFVMPETLAAERRAPPRELFGIALAAEKLPENIGAAAQKLWQQGDQRGALSLLLRASLLRFVEQHHCHFREGDTEGDCLSEVRRRTPEALQQCFAQLIGQWQQVAYAHRRLDAAAFEALLVEWRPLLEPGLVESGS